MPLLTVLANVLALTMGYQIDGRLELLPPPSQTVLELTVQQWGRPHVERIRKPGTHTVELQCSHVPDRTAPLSILIQQQIVPAGEQTAWKKYTPRELLAVAPTFEPQPVQFVDDLAVVEPGAAGVVLPDGTRTTHAFRTRGGILCIVPEGRSAAGALASSALPGDRLAVRGRLAMLPGGVRAVLVEEIESPSDRPPQPKIRWDVTARWGEVQAARFNVAGEYPLNLPCAHVAGAAERVLLRLKESKHVALNVQDHPVDAELADTPEKRSYGLQGRDGMGKDEGMLFFFPHADRPTFVMKTVSFPLSIAFIRADGTIVHIAKLNPGDPRVAAPPVPVNYVLEMSQGWFEEHGVTVGGKAEIP